VEVDYQPSVNSRKDAIESLEWYALRWKIEIIQLGFELAEHCG